MKAPSPTFNAVLRAVALLIALALPCLAVAKTPVPAEVAVDCPETVAEGEPFFVSLSAEIPVEFVTIRWLDRELQPELWWEAGRTTASVLLGMGMRERLADGAPTLRVLFHTAKGTRELEQTVCRAPKAYPEQHLDVDSRYSELSEEDLARHERERADVRAALGGAQGEKRWHVPILRPVAGEVTSDFGLRRFFNGEPKKPHSGVDLAAARGTTVRACADGEIVLTGGHFFAGNSVYIDHGQGVVSMYFHLSEIVVLAGQGVRRGDVIGRAGSTGRVTGPHLHWGLSILGQLVDPLLLLGD